ncbi:MAG TPA: hypothetical protein VG722_01900 [Tepidisphaeraceae bacterium]|nr:hypothetical protein [Tepidisphaeraceae bacterium]
MMNNPIVDEVHRIREELLAKFGGDLHALARDLQRKTEEARAAGKRVVERPPHAPRGDAPENKLPIR